jgi:hypothetical protein
MLPRELHAEHFAHYRPRAHEVAVANLEILQKLPMSFLPNLLREVIEYDVRFPAERKAIDQQLAVLRDMSAEKFQSWFAPFEQITVDVDLEKFNWVDQPAQFVEQLSAHLWRTHQLDAFRNAATDYQAKLEAATPSHPLPVARLGIAIIGQQVASYDEPLFSNLRQHGTFFDQIKPENGLQLLLNAIAERAGAHPEQYAHWYIDGGLALETGMQLTCVSFAGMDPVRAALLKNMQKEIEKPGMGPEELRTHMSKLTPADLGFDKAGDEALDWFKVKILTEGSGTQIFSTTFAQWTTREALRRAQPLTMLVRFAPRQRQRPMNELLSNSRANTELDPVGSLVDADMAAYYHWINQQRLPGDSQSVFLTWFEDHNQALVVAPTLPRGTKSSSQLNLKQLLALAIG